MNKKTILLFLLLPLASGPVLGQEVKTGFYVAPFGGVAIFRDGSVEVDHPLSVDADFEIKSGYSAGLRGGYDFGLFRLEGEFSYMEGRIRRLETNTGPASVRSEAESYGYMLNALVDYELNSFVFSIGAGAGASRVKFGEISDAGLVLVADTRDTVFTYQGILSSAYRLSENALIGANYRYLVLPDVSDRGSVDTNPMGRTDIDYDGFAVNLLEVFVAWQF